MAATMPVARGSRIAAAILIALSALLLGLGLSGLIGPLVDRVDFGKAIWPGSWMAWTWAGAAFFIVIACLLVIMTLWGALAPESPRVGALGIETTPGDRLFISLLGSAFIHLAWLGLVGEPLWGALTVSLAYAAAIFRWA